jgi:uncharacterized RDD family membrane protein YckC
MDPARGPVPETPSAAGRSPAKLAGRRIAAWCVDWLVVSVYALALVPLGLVLSGHVGRLSPVTGNTVGLVVLVVPVVVWLAAWERGPGGASPGKRMLRLRVEADGGTALGWRRSLLRSALKVGLPWELGHTMAFAFADPHAPPFLDLAWVGVWRGVRARRLVRRFAVRGLRADAVRPGYRKPGGASRRGWVDLHQVGARRHARCPAALPGRITCITARCVRLLSSL